MENFVREKTEDTPYILFDCHNHVLEIRGLSFPEDAIEFYTPAFQWLEQYFTEVKPTQVTVNIETIYFHSGSTEILLYFFDKLTEQAQQDVAIIVNWFYKPGQRDIREQVEEFQDEFTKLRFQFIEKG